MPIIAAVLNPFDDGWCVGSANTGFEPGTSWWLFAHDMIDHNWVMQRIRRTLGRGSEEAVALGASLYRAWRPHHDTILDYVSTSYVHQDLPCVGTYRGKVLSVSDALVENALYDVMIASGRSVHYSHNTVKWMRLGWHTMHAAGVSPERWGRVLQAVTHMANTYPLHLGVAYRVRLDFDNNTLTVRPTFNLKRLPSWQSPLEA